MSGSDTVYALAKKYKLKTAFGTDILFSKELADRQGAQLSKMTRWYPYNGKMGVVQEGALADLLLVDGNPVENIKLVENLATNFFVIMKDGEVYKNLLALQAP